MQERGEPLKTTILFDLDGTLTDPGRGITKSVQYSLKKFDIPVEDLKTLHTFIGPPLGESFRQYFGFSEDQSRMAIDYYREYFSEKGLYENEIYPGIPDLLAGLKERGVTTAVATSKPTRFARQILEHFKLDHLFDEIIGSNLDNTRTDKKDIIAFALDQLNRNNKESLMVGDRKHDIIGAVAHKMESVGVLYGYGSREELEGAGADWIAGDVSELGRILDGLITP